MTTNHINLTADSDREAWLKERLNGIGGSEVATVLGLNKYCTPLTLWQEKTGRAQHPDAGEAAYWGTVMEDIVAKEFSKRTGMKIQRVNAILTTGENGWMRGNIDRAIVNPEVAKRVHIYKPEDAEKHGRLIATDMGLECKTASIYMAELWGDSQEAEIKAGKVETDHKIPLYYETQVQWYMAVTGLSRFYVAVLIGGNDFRIYQVDRNQAVIDAVVEKVRHFWFENVLKDVPPAPINPEDVRKLYAKDDGEIREATGGEAVDIGELRNVKDKIKVLQAEEKKLASKVILAIGQNQGLSIGGHTAVTYKAQTANRFDSKRLKEEDPETYKDYMKESVSRVLRIK